MHNDLEHSMTRYYLRIITDCATQAAGQLISDYLNDSDETELIEKALVENILGNGGSYSSKKVDTYYGSEYVYYIGSYKTAFDTGTGYHTEFIFQADGEDGIVVMLYVYKEAKHLSDILFVSRFLKMN